MVKYYMYGIRVTKQQFDKRYPWSVDWVVETMKMNNITFLNDGTYKIVIEDDKK